MQVKIFIINAIVLLTGGAYAGNKAITNDTSKVTKARFLSIGEKVPDITINNLINYPSKSLKISDLRGKIIIIDYWATWCGSCIFKMPEEDALQKKYKGKVQFLLVTKQSNKILQAFLAKSKKYKKVYPHLTFASDDSLLHKLVPVYGYPTYAWIDGNGVLRNVTDMDSVTSKNIDNLLISNIAIEEKSIHVEVEHPLFVNGNGGDGSKIMTYSVFSQYVKDVDVHSGGEIRNGVGWLYDTNCPLQLLYQIGFYDQLISKDHAANEQELYMAPSLLQIPNNRVMIELKDSALVVGYINDTLNKRALYCYQLRVPEATCPELRGYLTQDLKRTFNFKARIEKRKIKCLVLTARDTSLLFSKGEKPTVAIDAYNWSLINMPLSRLNYLINYSTRLPPFIDETGYKGRADLAFNANIKDWRSIADGLKKYKLRLNLEDREIYMLVIGEKNADEQIQ